MDLRVHLKVCEGCGCLWYRSQFEAGVYCAPCDRRFQEFPAPQSRKRRGRPRKATLPTVHAVEDLAWRSGANSPAAAFHSQRHHHRATPSGSWTISAPPREPVAGICCRQSVETLAKGGAQ